MSGRKKKAPKKPLLCVECGKPEPTGEKHFTDFLGYNVALPDGKLRHIGCADKRIEELETQYPFFRLFNEWTDGEVHSESKLKELKELGFVNTKRSFYPYSKLKAAWEDVLKQNGEWAEVIKRQIAEMLFITARGGETLEERSDATNLLKSIPEIADTMKELGMI